VPVAPPTFRPNTLATQLTADTTGQIDVAFEITRFGRAKHVEVLESTTHASREAEKALVHEISRAVFRPRIVDAHVADAAPVVLRYYVAAQTATADGRDGP
jgi:hypothetical protein